MAARIWTRAEAEGAALGFWEDLRTFGGSGDGRMSLLRLLFACTNSRREVPEIGAVCTAVVRK